jgi:hypothetical protein
MGLSFLIRIVSIPHSSSRPPAQLLALLLPNLFDIPKPLLHFVHSSSRSSIPPIIADQLRPADDIVTRDGSAFRKTEGGSSFYVVRANSRIRSA